MFSVPRVRSTLDIKVDSFSRKIKIYQGDSAPEQARAPHREYAPISQGSSIGKSEVGAFDSTLRLVRITSGYGMQTLHLHEDRTTAEDVRYWLNGGKHMLVLSSSQFDPQATFWPKKHLVIIELPEG
jgi:hypothetical protein